MHIPSAGGSSVISYMHWSSMMHDLECILPWLKEIIILKGVHYVIRRNLRQWLKILENLVNIKKRW